MYLETRMNNNRKNYLKERTEDFLGNADVWMNINRG